ncbi:hypothetical protein KL936_004547 [Ogataea polymorpha]|nr:hypothetical protein KL936_004547 [Ogataea polymorpha]
MVDQIEFCDVIILNKTSGISKKKIADIEKIVHQLNPVAKVYKTDYCKIDLKHILNTGLYDFEKATTSAGWLQSIKEMSIREGKFGDNQSSRLAPKPETEEYGINNFVYTARKPFHPQRLYDLVVNKFYVIEQTQLDDTKNSEKPGTLTALMGVSGAGKTTLLDVLANRVTTGVVTGSIFVSGRERDGAFQRYTGYAQQQDLHVPTSTVREALRFSAYLRREKSVSKQEKEDYVEEIIELLEMESYAEAVIGVAGEGLNIEQRKRLTIAVELVAKPQLLLFLDEPTSGLDSQTAWSVCQLMRKLSDNGQAILCTIHQPSAHLLSQFDRLLFLARGGKTVYFGELGEGCCTLIDYFEKNGAKPCPKDANPAEWMLEAIGAAPGSHTEIDFPEIWQNSPERQLVLDELHVLETEIQPVYTATTAVEQEFATSFWTQVTLLVRRTLQQYYRTPRYLWSKVLLAGITSLMNGFTFFHSKTTQQGIQNQMLSTYLMCTTGMVYFQQLLPVFSIQRNVYESRERPSKLYSWYSFLLSSYISEFPWCLVTGTVAFLCWYLPTQMYKNAQETDSVSERAGLTWMLLCGFYIYGETLGYFTAVGFGDMSAGMNFAFLMFMLSMNFSGVLYYPTGFWKWLYYVSPLTYWISGIVSAGLRDTDVHCSEVEFVTVPSPDGETCWNYLSDYIGVHGGYLKDNSSTTNCEYCSYSESNVFLRSRHMEPEDMWRNWGILVCYTAFNIICAFYFYYQFRVPKKRSQVEEESFYKEDVDKEEESEKSKSFHLPFFKNAKK